MGKAVKRVETYTCDRCGFELDGEEIRKDEAANCGPSSREFSIVATVPERHASKLADPGVPKHWLCIRCTKLHAAFLAGEPLARDVGAVEPFHGKATGGLQ